MMRKRKTVLDMVREAGPSLTINEAEAAEVRLSRGLELARLCFKRAKKIRVIVESSPGLALVADYAVRVGDTTLVKVACRPVEVWELADFAAGRAVLWDRWDFVQKVPKTPPNPDW